MEQQTQSEVTRISISDLLGLTPEQKIDVIKAVEAGVIELVGGDVDPSFAIDELRNTGEHSFTQEDLYPADTDPTALRDQMIASDL